MKKLRILLVILAIGLGLGVPYVQASNKKAGHKAFHKEKKTGGLEEQF